MHEDMQEICNYLCQTLRQTRRFYDLLHWNTSLKTRISNMYWHIFRRDVSA